MSGRSRTPILGTVKWIRRDKWTKRKAYRKQQRVARRGNRRTK